MDMAEPRPDRLNAVRNELAAERRREEIEWARHELCRGLECVLSNAMCDDMTRAEALDEIGKWLDKESKRRSKA